MYAMLIMLAFTPVYIVRVLTGPSIWDRLHGLNLISAKLSLTIILYASFTETSYFLDLAIVFSLLCFIGVIFTALFCLERHKGGGAR